MLQRVSHADLCALRVTVTGVAQVTLTTGPVPEGGGNVLPVSYDKFTSMVQPGDTVFLGRYLVTGSEDSSLYLTVRPRASWTRCCYDIEKAPCFAYIRDALCA